MKSKILVTGGAGYIGSITVQELIKAGYEVVVFDNLVHGHKEAIKGVQLIEADLLDKKAVNKAFSGHKFDAVIHFAAYALAGESMTDPAKYFENNIIGGTNLLEAMRKHEVKNFVFSSTCAVYGFPENLPVTENESHKPVSVYGQSKDMFENVLDWYDKLFNIKHINLRYFNACGAALDGSTGEAHSPESHIIPIAIEAALGKRDKFTIFGDDYKTDDGTCVRDYIHILDLASAHIKALEYLKGKDKSNAFNLGTGNGYSNKKIIDTVRKVSGKDFKVVIGPRREGDPDAIFADNTKAVNDLGWEPKYSDLDTIIKSAYKWHKSHPNGYS